MCLDGCVCLDVFVFVFVGWLDAHVFCLDVEWFVVFVGGLVAVRGRPF